MYRPKKQLLIIAVLIPFLTGCAFFNALYNGWQAFNTAYKTEEEMYRNGNDTLDVQNATKKDYERAVAKAEKAISYYPRADRTHDDAFYLKGRALYQMSSYAEAIPVFKTLQEYYPESKRIPKSWLYLGMSYAGNGNYPAADETYTYVIETFPELNKNQEVVILRADLAVLMKGKSAAITFLEEALKEITNPGRKMYMIDRIAELYIDLKMYEKALSHLSKKPPLDKSYKGLYYTASVKEVNCYKELDEFDKAETILLELIKNRHFIQHNDEMRFELAMLYDDQNRFEDARKIFEDLVNATTGTELVAESWYQLSLIQIDLDNDLEKGENSLTKVIEITKNPELKTLAKKRLEGLKMVTRFNDSLDTDLPDSISEWDLRFKLGERYWLDAKLPDSALVQYDMILEDSTVVDTVRVKTLYSKAWILQEVKEDSASAKVIFEEIIEKYPTYAEAKESQKLLDIPVTIMLRRDSAETLFADAEKLRLASKEYNKDVYYSYLLTAVKFPDIEDVAAKSLYAAGYVVNKRTGVEDGVDTAAAKVYGRLCRDYPESEQCKAAEVMLKNGQVKGYVDSYTKFLEEKGSSPEDSTTIATDIVESVFSEELPPIELPDFQSWF